MIDFVIVFFAPISMAILYNSKKRRFIYIGICGLIGYLVYFYTYKFTNTQILSTCAGSLFIGLFSETFARILKCPSIIFSIPACINLVPGIAAYNTAKYLIEDELLLAAKSAITTIGSSGAIALGVMLSTATFKIIYDLKNDPFKGRIQDVELEDTSERH